MKIRPGMMASLSGNLATMGPAVPYSVAAKFAFPDPVVVALAGDGAMQMNGMAELITISKYWKEWKDPRLVVLVLVNCDLDQVTWEQRVMMGDPKLEASQDLPAVDFAAFAESLGLAAVEVLEAADHAVLGDEAEKRVLSRLGLDVEDPGFSCRTQIAQRTGRRALHLAEALRARRGRRRGGRLHRP